MTAISDDEPRAWAHLPAAFGLHFPSTMSRIAGLLLVVLGATAFADTTEPSASPPKSEEATPAPKPNKFPLRVVKVLPDSEQALLFDKHRGRHVLVEVGETVGDYTVASIDEDEVTLTGKDVPVEVVLAAPETRQERRAAKQAAKEAAAKQDEPIASTDAAPADPYADDGEEPAPHRTVSHREASADGEGEKSTTSPFESPAADKPTAAGPTKLSKKEVSAALTDFAKLASSIDGSFTRAGLTLEKVQAGSVFAKAGLAIGDVVTAVDGKPLKTIDDAADLYARAGGMKSATVQLVRAGKPQTLRIAIQ